MGSEFRCPDILKPPNSTKQNPALHWIKPNIITQLWHKDKDTSPHFMVSSWSVSNGQKLWEFSDSLNGDPCQHVSHVVCVCNWQCHRKCSLSTSTCASICCSVWDEKCVYRRKDTSLFWYVWFPVRMTSVLRYISVLNSWSSARSKYQTTFTLLHFYIFHLKEYKIQKYICNFVFFILRHATGQYVEVSVLRDWSGAKSNIKM